MHHFRHDILLTGLCLNSCIKKLDKLNEETYNAMYVEYFDANIKYNLNPNDFDGTLEYRKEYDDMVNRCINLYLSKEYDLMGYSTINFCTSNKETKKFGMFLEKSFIKNSFSNILFLDSLDWTFVIITSFVVFMVFLATIYDIRKRKNRSIGSKSTKKEEMLLSFSVISNWERLISIPKEGVVYDFRYIQGVRFCTMFIIIYGHINIGYTGAPLLNPEYHETKFHSPFQHIALNGTIVVQAFFFISGFLLSVHFIEELLSKRKYSFKYFWVAVFYRYLRLTPVYAYIMLYNATFLYKSQQGPLWKRQGGIERLYCRKNWWTNLLYINNHVNVEEGVSEFNQFFLNNFYYFFLLQCMPHSWYMAADTQLFVMGMFVLMVVWKLVFFLNFFF